MSGNITLTLLDLKFFSYHGWYEQETATGQPFVLNLWIIYPEPQKSLQQLSDTVDYTLIYELVRRQMNQPRKLLEELAQSILSEIHETFPQVTELKIHIEKTAPPVENFSGRLGIQLTRTF